MSDQHQHSCDTPHGANMPNAPVWHGLATDADAFITDVQLDEAAFTRPCSPGYSDSLFPLDSLLQDPSFPSIPLTPPPASPTDPIHPTFPSSATSSDDLFAESLFTPPVPPDPLPVTAHDQHPAFPASFHQHAAPPRQPSPASDSNTPPSTDPSQPPPHHASHPTPPAAAPRATPGARRKKLRPSDRLTTLQKHLDTISSQVNHLTLRNRQLWKTKHVLDQFAECLATCETLSARVKADIANSRADPTAAPEGPTRFCDWTPEQFAEMYRGHVVKLGESIVQMEAAVGAGATTALEAMGELAAAHEWRMEAIMYAMHGRFDFMPRVMVEQLKFFPGTISEELHWAAVLAAMELTEGQVEDLLVARDVFLRCSQNLSREQDFAKAILDQATPRKVAGTSCAEDTAGAEHVSRLATNLGKHQSLAAVLYLFWFHHTLTPLQVARANIHAYPLLPCPAMLMNVLSSMHGQTTSEIHQEPALGLFGTVRSVSELAEQLMGASHPRAATSVPAAVPGALITGHDTGSTGSSLADSSCIQARASTVH